MALRHQVRVLRLRVVEGTQVLLSGYLRRPDVRPRRFNGDSLRRLGALGRCPYEHRSLSTISNPGRARFLFSPSCTYHSFPFSSRKESLILVASPRASLVRPYPLSDCVNFLRHAQRLWSAFPGFCLPVRRPKGFCATIRSSRKTPGFILRRRQRYTRDKNHPFWSVCFMSYVWHFFDDNLYRQALLYMVTSEVALSLPRPLVWLFPSHRVSTSARKVLLCT